MIAPLPALLPSVSVQLLQHRLFRHCGGGAQPRHRARVSAGLAYSRMPWAAALSHGACLPQHRRIAARSPRPQAPASELPARLLPRLTAAFRPPPCRPCSGTAQRAIKENDGIVDNFGAAAVNLLTIGVFGGTDGEEKRLAAAQGDTSFRWAG